MLNGLVCSWFLKGAESMEPAGTEGSKGPSTCSDFSSTAFERKRNILGNLISAFGGAHGDQWQFLSPEEVKREEVMTVI